MSRSDSGWARWFGRRGSRTAAVRPGPPTTPARGAGGDGTGDAERLLVEEYDGIRLLRTSSDDTISDSDVLDLARVFGAEKNTVTVVAGAGAPRSADLWPRLGGLLDDVRAEGTGTVRLVLAAAGDDRPGAPALARRIADAWRMEVIAPDGAALVVPGGGLFVPPRRPEPGAAEHPARGGWWRFAPDEEPRCVGARQPVPDWQSAVDLVPGRVAGGSVIEQLPAGLLARSPGSPPPRHGDLCYAVPADPRGPTVLVGGRESEEVPADDIAEVLGALPESVRERVMLAPGGSRDILAVGQSVSDTLGTGTVVYTGMPLLSRSPADRPGKVRAVLVGADGAPRWEAYVGAVRCVPAAAGEAGEQQAAPEPLPWSLAPGEPAEGGAIRLSAGWRADLTRAGLWLTDPSDGRPPATDRPVDPEGPAIEVGRPGQPLDASLFPALAELLGGLGADVRGRARLFVHGTSADGGRELRRIAAENGLRAVRFAPRGAVPPAPAPVPLSSDRDRESQPSAPTPSPAIRTAPPPPGPLPAPEPAPARGPGEATGPAAPRRRQPTEGSPVPEPALITRALTGTPLPEPPVSRAAPSVPSYLDPIELPAVLPASMTPAEPGVAAPPVEPARALEPARPRERARPEESMVHRAFSPSTSSIAPTAAVPPDRTGSAPVEPAPETPEPPVPDPAAPETPEPPAPARPAAPPAVVVPGPLPPVPVPPGYATSAAERAAFRGLGEDGWERHGAAVTRALTKMPALRGQEQAEARDDLIALHMYLHTTEGPLSHGELGRSLRAGEARLLPYAACVSSALRRLPSYRGLALRGTDAADAGLVPGNLLRDATPVGALPLGSGAPRPGGAQYAIWSATGRRVRELVSGPGAAGRDMIMFAPGSLLRVLDVRESDGAPLVLLREVPASPATATTETVPQGTALDDHDRVALDRLDQALRRHPLAPGQFRWPELCAGPLGRRGDAAGAVPGAR
ncbi:hypothetical protein [Streptomyces sp. NBC_00370]|uniref:hypothetical protein n=1 Tax=Streptomyces sp. NBC_00370 TaxID=2975728 RepID=UPI002E272C63